VERVYDVRDLMTRPGIVVLTPGFLTIVDVDEQVEQAVSARSDLFEMRVFGNSIYLRPTKRAGTSSCFALWWTTRTLPLTGTGFVIPVRRG
jgi:hypothetical protein